MSINQLTAFSADASSNIEAQNRVNSNPNDKNDSASIKNEFISLMVAQIQNQDPLNPLDGTEYVTQLATFSQVESTENMAKMMQNSTALLDNMQILSTASLVGKTVYVAANEAEISDKVLSGKIELEHASRNVTLVLQNEYGQESKVALGARDKGDVDFSIDPQAMDIRSGKYQIYVELEKGQAQPITLLAGEVSQVRVPSNGGAALVNVDGVVVFF